MKLKSIVLLLLLLAVLTGTVHADTIDADLYVGQTMELRSKIISESGQELNESVQWTTSDKTIATVSNGVITAKAKGEVTITATVKEGASIRNFKVYLTVHSTIRDVTLHPVKTVMYVGEKQKAEYTLHPFLNIPAEPYDKVTFTTTNKDILTVDKNGVVYAKSPGQAYVKITTVDGKRTDAYQITVKSMVTAVTIDNAPSVIKVGERLRLEATVFPENAFNKSVSWTGSSQVKVDRNGLVTGLKAGDGYITVITDDAGKRDTIKFEVKSLVKGIALSESEIRLNSTRKEYQLNAEVIPASTTEVPILGGIKWSTNKKSVAVVSRSGKVTAKSSGIAIITAETEDGGYTATVTVRVNMNESEAQTLPDSIRIMSSPERGFAGEKLAFYYQLTPSAVTADDVDVHVYGGEGKLVKHKGFFEFTPYDAGRYNVSLETENGKTASTSFYVQSTVKDIVINYNGLVKRPESGRYTLYLNQSGSVSHELVKADSAPSILLPGTTWTSSDKNIVTITKDGRYSAKSIGQATLTIESQDSSQKKHINVEVVGMAESVRFPATARVGLKILFRPALDFTPKTGMYYGYSKVLNQSYEMKMTALYVPKDFLRNEREYENERQDKIKRLLSDGFGSEDELKAELEKSRSREDDIRAFLKSDEAPDDENFVLINDDDRTLLGRDFKTLEVARVKSNSFYATIVCLAEVEIVTKDGEFEETMLIYGDSEIADFLVYDAQGNLLTTPNLASSTEDILTEKTIGDLKSEYRLPRDKMPSDGALAAIDRMREKGLVPESFESDFQRGITRMEMVKFCINLIHEMGRSDRSTFTMDLFTDTTDPAANDAYHFGLVKATSDRRFYPDVQLSREEMIHMLYRSVLAAGVQLDPEKSPKTSSAFTDFDEIDPVYLPAAHVLSIQHQVVTGLAESMYFPKSKASIESVLVYADNILSSIQ